MAIEKTENVMISRGDMEDVLALYNKIDSMVDEVSETFDIDISTLRDLRKLSYKVKARFEFRPQKDDNYDDRPCHWKPCVLPDDDRAWYYNDDS